MKTTRSNRTVLRTSLQPRRILLGSMILGVGLLGILGMEHIAAAVTPVMRAAGWRSIGEPMLSGTKAVASTQVRPPSGYVHSGAMPQRLPPEPLPSRQGPVRTMPLFPIGKAHIGAAIGGGQEWHATGSLAGS